MTVKELFNGFRNWFDTITYQVLPSTTGEFGTVNDKGDDEKEGNRSFLDRFEDYIVEDWEFLNYDNALYLTIKKK